MPYRAHLLTKKEISLLGQLVGRHNQQGIEGMELVDTIALRRLLEKAGYGSGEATECRCRQCGYPMYLVPKGGLICKECTATVLTAS